MSLGMIARALPGGDTLRWDCGSFRPWPCLSSEGLDRTTFLTVETISQQHLHLQQCMDTCASSSLEAVGGRLESDPFSV